MLHRMYSIQQKHEIAKYARMHRVRPAASDFGIPRKNVQHWSHKRLDELKGRGRKHRKGQGPKITSKPRWQSPKLILDSKRLTEGHKSSSGTITL